ncbi:unnamed protein product [Prunus armeniaca]
MDHDVNVDIPLLPFGAAAIRVHLPHRCLKMSNVAPPNDHVSYLGDQPWHVPFPSPAGTPNNNPTSSGSEADNNDPLDKYWRR